MAQWIRPRTLNGEVPSSNLLAAAVVPLGKALHPHCLVPRKGLEAVDPLVACFLAAYFLSGKINPTILYSYYNYTHTHTHTHTVARIFARISPYLSPNFYIDCKSFFKCVMSYGTGHLHGIVLLQLYHDILYTTSEASILRWGGGGAVRPLKILRGKTSFCPQ